MRGGAVKARTVAVDQEPGPPARVGAGIRLQPHRDRPACLMGKRPPDGVCPARDRPDVGDVLIVGVVHAVAVAGIAGCDNRAGWVE